MAEPHATTLAAAFAAVGIAAEALGIQFILLPWAVFGGLLAIGNTEPKQPPLEGLRLGIGWVVSLFIAVGVGLVFNPFLCDIAVAVAAKFGVALTSGVPLQRAAAVLLAFSTAFLPEVRRILRKRLAAIGGAQS